MSEWVSEWVRGSVTLNKILACFYSFSHTGYSTIDWLTINSAVLSLSLTLSLTLTLLTLTLLLWKYCYSETINGNRWHKNYIDYGSHSINQSSHCKKKNATSLILIKTREMIWFNLIIGLKITTTSSSSVIILLGGGEAAFSQYINNYTIQPISNFYSFYKFLLSFPFPFLL